jgi:hypothetical protein
LSGRGSDASRAPPTAFTVFAGDGLGRPSFEAIATVRAQQSPILVRDADWQVLMAWQRFGLRRWGTALRPLPLARSGGDQLAARCG